MRFTKTQSTFPFIFLLCSAFFLAPVLTQAQTVNIPDSNLRAAIAAALDKAPNDRITRDDMKRLDGLEAHNAGISNLTGLQFATNLEVISCNNNSISDLSPLADLPRLAHVEHRHNLIRDLSPLGELPVLERLIVNDNLITDLSPVRSFPRLLVLEVSGNAIVDFSPVARLTKLQRIFMSRNPRADLAHFSGLTNLVRYHSWGTPVRNLSTMARLPKLKILDVCGGEISDVSGLAGATQIEELYLVGNDITDISPLASMTGLERLSLENNNITDVAPIAALPNLRWLELAHNRIFDFSPLNGLSSSVSIVATDNPGASEFRPNTTKIDGPWLWMVIPTDGTAGANAAASGTDFLRRASNGTVTESRIARQGAVEGESVGDRAWTLSEIDTRNPNNINPIGNILGVGMGDINRHVAYGSINLDSANRQNTTMFVGADDAVKVWLNGDLVHTSIPNEVAEGFQESFPVTLEEGTNSLLVAIYEANGWWSGFFGFPRDTRFTTWTQSPPHLIQAPRITDVDGDGQVSILDLILVARNLGSDKVNPNLDVNSDGRINILDLNIVARSMDDAAGAPFAFATADQTSPDRVRAWIAQAELESDGSVVFQEGIANLRQLLAALIPESTALLANYPNPFNPETWIPYQLAAPADITLRIYAVEGAVVRTLHLGHQSAGRYHQRSRAAYWNGENDLGEPVASGLYFYTLTAGDFTATRKMFIKK